MKYIKKLAMAVLAIISLTACGGGGGSDSNSTTTPINWKIQFHAGSMVVQVPIDEKDNVVSIVDANGVETISKDDLVSVSWNGKCAWPTSTVVFAGNPITITGVDSSGDTGLITIATVDKIYSVNIDSVDTTGSTVPVSIDKVNGLIAYGDGIPECKTDPDPLPSTLESKISIISYTANIDFNSDLNTDISYCFVWDKKNVTPEDIIGGKIWWNSDLTGWGDEATLSGDIVSTASKGMVYCQILGMPVSDEGNFTYVSKEGERVWLDIGRWSYSENFQIDFKNGLLSY
ncbi:MAG: hypothetical protein WC678_04410 [Parcubacteria group bacterium]|jgi:hypothetical protein